MSKHLKSGNRVIDATAGNGHDTLWLAKYVSPGGHVTAIDRQAIALAQTRSRLQSAGYLESVELIEGSHADLIDMLPESERGEINAVVFNLGYLPGSDKHVITQSDSTRKALDASRCMLKSGGLLSILIYRGHPGGHEEEAMILRWIEENQSEFDEVTWNDGDHPTQDSPRLLIARRR
ncbi:MAG: class I SAM-dependent methyltransferase [Verrucomicrobiota bacterium]